MDYLPIDADLTDKKQAGDILEFICGQQDSSRRFDRDFKVQAWADFKYLNGKLPEHWRRRFFNQNFLPETLLASRDVRDDVIRTLFSRDNFMDIWAEDGQTDVQIELLRLRTRDALIKAGYKGVVHDWGGEAIDYGNGVCCTYAEPDWDDEDEGAEEPAHDEVFNIHYSAGRQPAGGLRSSLRMYAVSRFDCYPFPGKIADIQRMPFFIVQEDVPWSVFQQRAKWRQWDPDQVNDVKPYAFSDRAGRDDDSLECDSLFYRLASIGFNVLDEGGSVAAVKFVRLWHYYEAPPGGAGCRAYGVVANGKQIMCCRGRETRHKDKSLADIRWSPGVLAPDLWQCIGVPRMMRPYQDMLNHDDAVYRDSMDYWVRPPRIVGPRFGHKPLTNLRDVLPGTVLGLKDGGDLNDERMLDLHEPSNGLLQLSDRAALGIQRASRTDAARGIAGKNTPAGGSGAIDTATGWRILTNADAKAGALAYMFFEQRGLEPQLRQAVAIVQDITHPDGELLSLPERNAVLQKAGLAGNRMLVKPQDIAGKVGLRVVGSSQAMDGPEMAANMIGFGKDFFNIQGVIQRYDPIEYAKEVYTVMTHRNDLSRFERSEEERQEIAAKGTPLPPQSKPKFADLAKKFPIAAKKVLEREGLPVDDPNPPTDAESAQHTELAKTQREVVKAAVRKPRFVPRQEVVAGV